MAVAVRGYGIEWAILAPAGYSFPLCHRISSVCGKGGKNILEPVALMCKGEHAKAARDLLTSGASCGHPKIALVSQSCKDLVNGISQRMLTTTLRNLEQDGFLPGMKLVHRD